MSYNREMDEISITTEQLMDMIEMLDQLHTAASNGDATTFTNMNAHDLGNMLRDMIYIAQQTIDEVDAHERKHKPLLRLLELQEKKKIG